MNFQALHFSSEDEFDDSSVDSYESSDEEGDMVGGAFPRFGNNKKDPETESFLKKLFYYSHMDGDDVAFEIKPDMNIDTIDQIVEKRDETYIAIKRESQQQQKKDLQQQQQKKDLQIQLKSLQKQIDDLQQTKKMEKFDIRILHYIDVLMQIKTCKANTSSDKKLNKLNKDSLKWLYHEYITDDKERKIFYENVLFHDASFNESAVVNAKLFESMNDYYFLLFSCHDIDEEQGKYRNKIVGVMNVIKTIFKQLETLSPSIKSKIKKIIDDKIGITYRKNSIQTRDAILSYIENSKKDIKSHNIQLKENSSTENIRETISNFLNNEYKTNNTIDNFEIYDKFWKQKEHQYENIPLDKKGGPNKYPFLIINQRKHTFPRFNIVFHKDTYAENVKKWFELCHTYEFTPISAENTMGLTEQYYNGLNVTFAYDYKNYYPFEIRFHTLETFMMKEIPHYHLERLGEDTNNYSFEFKFKNRKQFGINITAKNPPEIIEPIINDIIGLFENLKYNFDSTDDNKAGEFKKNDDEMEEPVDFVKYITTDEKMLTKHQYKTILYFLIANQSEEDLKLALGGKKKSSDFAEFEKIYKDLKDTQFEKKHLYDEILNSIFSNYLEYLKEKMYTYDVTSIIANKLIPREIHFSADIRKFIQQHEIYHLKSQLQKICNDNMILKHFIANDPRIRFDIEESKTPPEEPFNPFPNLLGYELIVNQYMELVMNRESVETTPLSGVEESKGPETQEEDNEEKEEGEMKQEEQENEEEEIAVVNNIDETVDTNLESKIQNAKNSLNKIIQKGDPKKPMMNNNADAEKKNEKLDILMKLRDQQEHIDNALKQLTNRNDDTKKRKLNDLKNKISAGPPVENIDDEIKAILETNNQIPPGIESVSAKNSLFDAKQNETRPPSTTVPPK